MEVCVGGFVKRNKAHQRIPLLERVAADFLAGRLGIPREDSGNDDVMMGLVSLQSAWRDHLESPVWEYSQREPLGGLDQSSVVTSANDLLVEGEAEISVLIGVAATAKVPRRRFVNIL